MRDRACLVGGAILGLSAAAGWGQVAPAAGAGKDAGGDGGGMAPAFVRPEMFSMAPEPDTVYAPPAPPREDEGVNQGGVNFAVNARYMTDYVYRGVDRSEVGGSEDSPNYQADLRIEFNLGKLPHPFVGLFANVYDSDPVSRFQEIRPFFGADWTLRPFVFEVGHNTYIYPERDKFETSEVYGKLTFDDSIVWHTERPLFSPYVYAAWDYDRNEGWYLEAGIKHDFVLEDYGITLTTVADVAAVQSYAHQFVFTSRRDSGFQHYDVGLIASYSLNRMFNVSRRYGDFTLEGYLYYTDGIDNKILADTQIWGGVGIGFRY